MILWLWDAEGPDHCGHGVTDDETRAVLAAETYMRVYGATSATVEAARLVFGMEVTYIRIGRGRQGHSSGTGVEWELAALTE